MALCDVIWENPSHDGKLIWYELLVSCESFNYPLFRTFYLDLLLKVHFVIHSLIPPFFSKKLETFTPVDAFYRYIMYVYKIFLKIHLFGKIIAKLSIYYVDIILPSIVQYATLWFSKTCITHKRNLRIDWTFGNKLIFSISTDLCHKISMLGSQNGPLNWYQKLLMFKGYQK